MASPSSPERRKDRYFLICLLLPALFRLCFCFPQLTCGGRPMALARAGTASSLLSQLEQATKAYELDFAGFPPGDGSGTAELMRCLTRSRKPKGAYFEFSREELTSKGDVRNPVDPDKVIHYRCPGLHRPASFDLWCEDADGHPDGINNWNP